MSLEPFNKTLKMSSPSDSSSCTSESDLESFTVDEVIGELSEFAPYDDSWEPLATEEEAADYNERVHRKEEEEQQFQRRYSGEVLANEWYGIIMECRFIFLFSNFNRFNSNYPSLNRVRDERDYVFCLSLQFRCYVISCSPDFMR